MKIKVTGETAVDNKKEVRNREKGAVCDTGGLDDGGVNVRGSVCRLEHGA